MDPVTGSTNLLDKVHQYCCTGELYQVPSRYVWFTVCGPSYWTLVLVFVEPVTGHWCCLPETSLDSSQYFKWNLNHSIFFRLVGGKQSSFLFQSLERTLRALPAITLLLIQVVYAKPWSESSIIGSPASLNHKLLTSVQCWFRARWGTVDHLVRFETFAREAFVHNQHMVSISVDKEESLWYYMEVWDFKRPPWFWP